MINELFEEMIKYIKTNKRETLGGFIGLIIGILILTIGFIKAIFIVLCTLVGIFLGSKSYSEEDIKRFLERFFSPSKRI